VKSIEELLAPVSDDLPCGEDLDESVDFDTLRAAFDDNFAIDAGVTELDEGEPGPPPVDWRQLFGKIEGLFGQTKDLWLAISYARCGFVRGDADIVAQGLELTARLLEEQWDNVHPLVDDPSGRQRGPLFQDITRRGAFSMPFFDLPLVTTNRSSIRVEQLLDAHNNGGASDHFGEVRMALDQLDDDAKQGVADQLARMRGGLARIEAALREQKLRDIPDFSTVRDTIAVAQEAYLALAGFAPAAADEDDGGTPENADEAGDSAARVVGAEGPAFGGAVKSRDDVIKALGAIEQYYARSEPGHPVRLATARLRSWVNKDFMEILEDIAPGSMDEAKNVLLERRDVE
jgi:type VI secretion system protein ImpA